MEGRKARRSGPKGICSPPLRAPRREWGCPVLTTGPGRGWMEGNGDNGDNEDNEDNEGDEDDEDNGKKDTGDNQNNEGNSNNLGDASHHQTKN